MTDDAKWCRGDPPGWCLDFKAADFDRPEKPKPSPAERRAALIAKREARARELLAEWEKKERRATKKVREYRKVVRGYERRAAARAAARTEV